MQMRLRDAQALRLLPFPRAMQNTIQNTNTWRLNNTFLNNQQIMEEIKKEIKIYVQTNENEITTPPNLWYSVKAV